MSYLYSTFNFGHEKRPRDLRVSETYNKCGVALNKDLDMITQMTRPAHTQNEAHSEIGQ